MRTSGKTRRKRRSLRWASSAAERTRNEPAVIKFSSTLAALITDFVGAMFCVAEPAGAVPIGTSPGYWLINRFTFPTAFAKAATLNQAGRTGLAVAGGVWIGLASTPTATGSSGSIPLGLWSAVATRWWPVDSTP